MKMRHSGCRTGRPLVVGQNPSYVKSLTNLEDGARLAR